MTTNASFSAYLTTTHSHLPPTIVCAQRRGQGGLSSPIRIWRVGHLQFAICNLKLSEAWNPAGHHGRVGGAASVINIQSLSDRFTKVAAHPRVPGNSSRRNAVTPYSSGAPSQTLLAGKLVVLHNARPECVKLSNRRSSQPPPRGRECSTAVATPR